jgi:hypothetical protein
MFRRQLLAESESRSGIDCLTSPGLKGVWAWQLGTKSTFFWLSWRTALATIPLWAALELRQEPPRPHIPNADRHATPIPTPIPTPNTNNQRRCSSVQPKLMPSILALHSCPVSLSPNVASCLSLLLDTRFIPSSVHSRRALVPFAYQRPEENPDLDPREDLESWMSPTP